MQIAEKKIEGLDKKMDKLIQLLTNKIKWLMVFYYYKIKD